MLADSVLETASGQYLSEADYTHPLTQGIDADGRPASFYRQGNQIHLYPTPDDAYTIRYYYLVKPVNLENDNDTTALPVEWEKILVLGTQARLEKFLGESGNEAYLLYRDGLLQLKSRAPLKPTRRMRGAYRGYPG